MSSDSEYDENAASDQKSESEENHDDTKAEATTSNGQTNEENTEIASATWNDLVSPAIICPPILSVITIRNH